MTGGRPTGSGPKVLYVALAPPRPARSGNAMHIQTLGAALEQVADIRFLILMAAPDPEAEAATKARFKADFVSAPVRPKVMKALLHGAAALRRRERSTAKFRKGSLRAEALARIAAFDPDLIILGHTAVVDLVEPFGLDWSRVIVDHQNVESLNYRRLSETASGATKLVARVDYWSMARLERECGRAREQWAVSDVDRETLTRINGGPVFTVPNVAPDSAFDLDPAGTRPGAPPVIGFAGNYRYFPNVKAITELVDVMGALRRRGTACEAVAMGGFMPAPVQAAAEAAGIEVTGFVDDPAEVYGRFTLLVAPLRSGSGTKLKIVEALAMGIPVVTTPIGTEGLPLQSEGVGVVADSNDDIAEAVASLLSDRERLTTMGERARSYAKRALSVSALTEIVRERIDAFTQAGSA